MAKAKNVVHKLDLELTGEEAQLLADIYGWAITGGGARHQVFGKIYTALKEVGITYASARPRDINGTFSVD